MKLFSRKRSLLVKDNPIQIIVQAELSHFVGVERETMPFIHGFQVEASRLRLSGHGTVSGDTHGAVDGRRG